LLQYRLLGLKLKVIGDIEKFLQLRVANLLNFIGFWRFVEQISQNIVFDRF